MTDDDQHPVGMNTDHPNAADIHSIDVNTEHPDIIDLHAGDRRVFEHRARRLRAGTMHEIARSLWVAFEAAARRFTVWDARRRVLRRL